MAIPTKTSSFRITSPLTDTVEERKLAVLRRCSRRKCCKSWNLCQKHHADDLSGTGLTHAVESAQSVARIEVVSVFLKAGIPSAKITHLRALLEEGSSGWYMSHTFVHISISSRKLRQQRWKLNWHTILSYLLSWMVPKYFTCCMCGKVPESISSHSRISAEFWAEFTTWRAEFQADKKQN